MKTKIITIILFVLSIILIAGFFFVTPAFMQTNGEYKHFEGSEIAFDLAPTWTVYEYDDPIKTPFLTSTPNEILLNPVNSSQYSYINENLSDVTSKNTVLNTSTTNATDVVIVKTIITKINSLPEGISIDNAYQSDSLYGIMNGSGTFEIVSNSTFDINGKTAHQFIYDVSSIRYQDTWIEANGHYYRIQSQAPLGVYSDAESTFNITTHSFKIK